MCRQILIQTVGITHRITCIIASFITRHRWRITPPSMTTLISLPRTPRVGLHLSSQTPTCLSSHDICRNIRRPDGFQPKHCYLLIFLWQLLSLSLFMRLRHYHLHYCHFVKVISIKISSDIVITTYIYFFLWWYNDKMNKKQWK